MSHVIIWSLSGFGCHCNLVITNLLFVGLYVCVRFIVSNVKIWTEFPNANAICLPFGENWISFAKFPFSFAVWSSFFVYSNRTLTIEFWVKVTIYFSSGQTQKLTISSPIYIDNKLHAWFYRQLSHSNS